jgi:hypothetical protein
MNHILEGSKRIKERYSSKELDLSSQEELKEKLQEFSEDTFKEVSI